MRIRGTFKLGKVISKIADKKAPEEVKKSLDEIGVEDIKMEYEAEYRMCEVIECFRSFAAIVKELPEFMDDLYKAYVKFNEIDQAMTPDTKIDEDVKTDEETNADAEEAPVQE